MEVNKDFEYIKAFNSGDEKAFNLLAQQYQKKIYWHARRMLGNHLDADEIAQEVLIVMYNQLKNFNFQSALYTWIYRITTTRSINYINKKKIKKFLFLDDMEKNHIESKEDIVKKLEAKERLMELDKVLLKLPTKQREVFSLRHFEELSYEEISEITGKSVGGLKANYFHALKKVMELSGNEKD